MKKLIVSDLDGTLLNSQGNVSEYTLNILDELTKQGHILVLCTGRPAPSAQRIIEAVQLKKKKGYFCGGNGQSILSFKTNVLIEKEKLTPQDIHKIMDIAKSVPVIAHIFHEPTNIISPTKKFMFIQIFINFIHRLSWMLKQSHSFQHRFTYCYKKYVQQDVIKICFSGNPKHLRLLATTLNQLENHPYSTTFVHDDWLECQTSQISKGNAVKYIAEIEQISAENIIVFGDGENDLSMFEVAKTSVAMENAMPKPKQAASCVTLSNDKDGVAHWLEENLLKKS